MEKVHAPDVATYVYNLTLCSAHDGTYEDWKNNEYVQFQKMATFYKDGDVER